MMDPGFNSQRLVSAAQKLSFSNNLSSIQHFSAHSYIRFLINQWVLAQLLNIIQENSQPLILCCTCDAHKYNAHAKKTISTYNSFSDSKIIVIASWHNEEDSMQHGTLTYASPAEQKCFFLPTDSWYNF